MKEFYHRGVEIKDALFLQEKYEQFAASYLDSYLLTLSGFGDKLIFRVINKLSRYWFKKWFVRRWYHKKSLLAIQNYIECEAHRELYLKCASNIGDEKEFPRK